MTSAGALFRTLGCGVAACGLAAGALAQSVAPVAPVANNNATSVFQFTPTRDTPRSFAAYQVVLSFGRCAARANVAEAQAALETQPISSNEQQMWRFVDKMGGCGPLPTHTESLVRGTLAEGLYHAKVPVPPPAAPDDGKVDDFVAKLTEYNKLRDGPDTNLSAAMGCFAAADPADTDKLLAAHHGSPDELKLFDQLWKVNPTCAGAARPQQISLSFLRAFLAEAAWRYAIYAGKA